MEKTTKINIPVYAALILAFTAAVITVLFHPKQENYPVTTFPSISELLPKVAVINIDSAGSTTTLIKDKKNNQWLIGELGGYPADTNKTADFIKKVATAETRDIVSTNPAEYSFFGVEDITTLSSPSEQVAFVTYDGSIPVSFIIGKTEEKGFSFIRKTDSREILKINKNFSLNNTLPFNGSSAVYWTDNRLLNIKASDILSLQLTDIVSQNEESIVFTKNADGGFEAKANFESAAINGEDAKRIIAGLMNLRFINVSRLQDIKSDMQTVFKLEITLQKGIIIINFVKVGETEIRLEVLSTDKKLSEKYNGWLYLFPWQQILDIMPENTEGEENV